MQSIQNHVSATNEGVHVSLIDCLIIVKWINSGQ